MFILEVHVFLIACEPECIFNGVVVNHQ